MSRRSGGCRRRAGPVIGLALSVLTAASASEGPDAAVEAFLVGAAVVASEEIPAGITHPYKLTLELGGQRATAVFKSVRVVIAETQRDPGFPMELEFTDDYRYERAAYLLDRELGLGMVPVTVLREWNGEQGAVIAWIADAIDEGERRDRGLEPPDRLRWECQRASMRVFDALILNSDRNLGNQLITTRDWKLHLIDHSRSFRHARQLPDRFERTPIELTRDLRERLERLETGRLRTLLAGTVGRGRIKSLLARRDLILQKVESDCRRHGEARVFRFEGQAADATTAAPPIAFVDVRVVPFDGPRLLERQTVIVRGDRIAAIGPSSSTPVPEGAVILPGKGRWLMPGLADMHVHVWSEGDLVAFVANGVTTIRNMFGAPLHLQWRERLAAGSLFGPALYTAGPIIDGNPPTWPGSAVVEDVETAKRVVAEQQAAGYDFLKVYNGLSRDVYDAIVAAAAEAGIPFVGHVPTAVPLEHALASGQHSIEHLSGFGFALAGDGVDAEGGLLARWSRAWAAADAERIDGLVVKAGASRTWICPTLGVFDGIFASEEHAKRMLARPEMRFVNPSFRGFWTRSVGGNSLGQGLRAGDPVRDRLVRALHAGGARLVLGTDCPNPFLVPGFSIHDETEHWVEAGLTPYDVLRAGTRHAAELAGDLEEFGTVTVGKRADLLLLAADPLADVANVRERVGVMLRGEWLPEAELQRRLEEVAASYGND